MGIALLTPSYAALVCVNNLADDAKGPIRRPSGIVVYEMNHLEPSLITPSALSALAGCTRLPSRARKWAVSC